jgi:23S rRNA (uracil1939-C5)-methyltransferase
VKKQTLQPVKKDDIYEITVEGLGHSGEGVGRYEGFTVFIPYALPGEQVKVRITEVKKNYAKGKLLTVQSPASGRTEPPCPIYYECGGCQFQHLAYDEQLAMKRLTVVNAVSRIGKLENVTVHPVLAASNPWNYRNKMQFPVGRDGSRVALGCYAQGTHRIVDTPQCLIQHELNNKIVAAVRETILKLDIAPYDENTGSGVLRHILGRVGTASGEVMVVLVTAGEKLPQQEAIVSELQAQIPNLVSVIQNINPKRTNIILGEQTRTLWGRDTISDQLGPFTFRISARSFFQVNTKQAEALYETAVQYARLSGRETVIDAYCGTGTITLFLAGKAAKVYGIEIVKPAIEDAKKNAADNQVGNVEFAVGDAVDWLPAMYQKGLRPEVIVIDPPRAGCEQKVLETFAAMNPDRIVYVSCNPSSLARDLAILEELGYTTKEIQPVDMFPMTWHVECVALIERKKP